MSNLTNDLLKYAGFLLIAAGLVLGVSSVPTAYVPPLSLADEQLVGLTLNGPAGEVRAPDMPEHMAGTPIANRGDDLTPELLFVLRANGTERVQVKEFALTRWTGKWWFALSCLLLLGGAGLVRLDMKQRLAAAHANAQANTTDSPDAALAAIIDTIESLRRDLPRMTTDQDRNHAIIERLGEVQATHVPAFADARPLLISRHGLSGFAELMDHFAAMERQINRAWSAAADAVYEEAADSLERASAMAQDTRARLERA